MFNFTEKKGFKLLESKLCIRSIVNKQGVPSFGRQSSGKTDFFFGLITI